MQADQINCLKLLEIWDFLLNSPWHPDKGYPFRNAPFGAFFVSWQTDCKNKPVVSLWFDN